MADLVICDKQDLVDIADIIREKSGESGLMSLETMKQVGSTINQEIIDALISSNIETNKPSKKQYAYSNIKLSFNLNKYANFNKLLSQSIILLIEI